jgi:hypothetical protein
VDDSGVQAYFTLLGTDWSNVVVANPQGFSDVNSPKYANANTLPYPLELKARAVVDYFAVRLLTNVRIKLALLLTNFAQSSYKAPGELQHCQCVRQSADYHDGN